MLCKARALANRAVQEIRCSASWPWVIATLHVMRPSIVLLEPAG